MTGAFDDPVELVPGRLYAVGGMVPLDGRISWAPATASGFQAVNAYVLREGRSALLIDTGIPLHRDQIVRQLEQILPEGAELSIYLTRYEMDCVGNVGPIAARFGLKKLYTGGVYNPFDGFDQISSIGEDRDQVESRVQRVLAGHTLPVGDGGRSLEIVTPPFRMLTSYWGYDAATRTLFSADHFGQHAWPSPRYRPLAAPADDTVTAESYAAFIRSRYWWLEHVEPEGLLARVEALFAKYPIARLAPTHGSAVDDPVLVERQKGFMRRLLSGADQRARVPA